jgi:hypothetical protein
MSRKNSAISKFSQFFKQDIGLVQIYDDTNPFNAAANIHEVQRMCYSQCTNKEIADALGIPTDVLLQAYSWLLPVWRCKGLARLRQCQMEKAFQGDSSMLQFLGEEYLSQGKQKDINESQANAMQSFATEIAEERKRRVSESEAKSDAEDQR